MPTAKHVRFASMNVLYSLTSPPSTLPYGESHTKRRRGMSFSGVTPSSSSRTASSSQVTTIQPHVNLIPEIGLPPRTRSRTSSSSSRTSSSQGTPHIHPQSLPPQNPHIPLQLHFLLAYSPFVNSVIKYDLSFHPSMLAEYYPSSSLLEPATNPGVGSLTIKSPDFPWPIFVTPSTFSSTTPYITVVDVLNCLYHDLRTTVLKPEYEAVPPHLRREVDAAFWSRCRRVSDTEHEKRKGVKRVDFLMGRNRFLGLSGTRKGTGVWELNVSTWAGE